MGNKRLHINYRLFCLGLIYLYFGSMSILAIEPVVERVYVQTDKQIYLAGENLWTKLYVAGLKGEISLFSKIAYLELIGDTIPYVQQKIDVKNGIADSRIHLPVDMPTGNYRLVAYTRAMRNEGETVFFSRPVTVYNPFTVERIGYSQEEQNLSSADNAVVPLTSSVITSNKSQYSTRGQGQISIHGLDKDAYSLSLSIAKKENLPGMPPLTIDDWKANIPKEQYLKVASFLPEYEGHIVLGSIVSEDQSKETFRRNIITPLIAFPGQGIRLFSGQIKENGEVLFFTKRIDGTHDVVSSALLFSEKLFRVDIQSPFATHSRTESLSAPVVSATLQDELLERSIGVQAMQGFYGDTIWQTSYEAPHVVNTPERVYKLDEYTRFTTMQEVITEFVLGLRFRKINDKRFLSSLTEERDGFTSANTLVLLDGVPLLDHESIYNYDPLLVESIELYRGKYLFGGQMFDGIAYFKTYDQDYKGVKLDPSSQLFTYRGTEPKSHFFMPDYSDPAKRASRLPDMRHTLLWIPDIQTQGQPIINIPFFTSDLKGEFIVTIEGLSKTGQTIRSSATFRVE